MPSTLGEPFFGSVFPQVSCGLDDPRACFARRSSSRISSSAATPTWSPCRRFRSRPRGARCRRRSWRRRATRPSSAAAGIRCSSTPRRCPTTGRWQANLDEMEANARRYPIAAWKVFTHFPDAFGDRATPGGSTTPIPACRRSATRSSTRRGARRQDDLRPQGLRRRERGTRPPSDVPAAARDFPDVYFIVYHSGFEPSGRRGPVRPRRRRRRASTA